MSLSSPASFPLQFGTANNLEAEGAMNNAQKGAAAGAAAGLLVGGAAATIASVKIIRKKKAKL